MVRLEYNAPMKKTTVTFGEIMLRFGFAIPGDFSRSSKKELGSLLKIGVSGRVPR
jgi:hypothetical protein